MSIERDCIARIFTGTRICSVLFGCCQVEEVIHCVGKVLITSFHLSLKIGVCLAAVDILVNSRDD
jgi:hypothetical protein